ncbi:hypothetical protein SSX86_007107 [Deinandra increscens subsp. villosa]|uniref:Uncharacterized protein n=1 Tax=Deinandra increscens subsp. villosa TaxID=3103831 RepID=A0AAP0DGJ4_9ASTR
MEIAELNLISDFESAIKRLQNPSLISKFPQFYTFWTFGALILAVFATFTSVFNRIKMLVHQIRLKFLISCQNSCPQQIFDDDDFDFDFSDDGGGGGDGDTPSSAAESDDEEDLGSENGGVDGALFRVDGGDEGFGLRRRNGFSWSDFSAGKSVVELWDSFGLNLDFEDDEMEYGGEIPIWDFDRSVKLSSGERWPAAAAAAVGENVVVTAEMGGEGGGVGFGYDCRVGGTSSPAVYAAVRPRRRRNWADGGGGDGE